MPDWSGDFIQSGTDLSLAVLAARLAVSFALGCVVAGIYRLTYGRGRSQTGGLTATLVLLSILICMVTLVIGNSVARAFSLVGALAIVRFRTVVEDTRDTAFVIFAVAVGMAAGAGYWIVSFVGIPFVAVAAVLFGARNAAPFRVSRDITLTVRVGVGQNAETLLLEPLGKHLERSQLTAAATARQGAAIDLTYGARLRREDSDLALIGELNRIEGVQAVELRRC